MQSSAHCRGFSTVLGRWKRDLYPLFGRCRRSWLFFAAFLACAGAHGQTLTRLYAFPDGTYISSNGGLVESDGALWGTTSSGGKSSNGSIYTITFTGSLSTIYSFSQTTGTNATNSDGASPEVGLISGTAPGLLYGTCQEGGKYGEGTAYSIAITGKNKGTLVKLLDVNYNAGGSQFDDLSGITMILGPDGNFYGAGDQAVLAPEPSAVFEITPSGTYTGFPSNCGETPKLAFFGDTLYGASYGGSDYVNSDFEPIPGMFFSVTSSGTSPNILYNFDVGTVTFTPYLYTNNDGESPTSFILGADNNFYGTALFGGTNGSGTLFQITPGGSFTLLYAFSALNASNANSDGAYPESIIQADDGNFYGVTAGGGANGVGTLFEIAPGPPVTFTTLASFDPVQNGANPNSIMQASDGNLYGTAGPPNGIPVNVDVGGPSSIFKYPLKKQGGIAVFDPSGNALVSGDNSVDFGNGFTSSSHPTVARLVFRIENTGTSDLEIDCAFIAGGPFLVAHKGQPAEKLRPNESTFLALEMTPNEPVSVEGAPPPPSPEYGEARIISSDPDTPVFLIGLTGNGGGPAPEARKPKHKH